MSASTITRATWTDDDGTGTTGTILNNARLQADVYDKIDAMFGGSGAYATLSSAGNLRAEGSKGLGIKGIATGSLALSSSGDGTIVYDSTIGALRKSLNAGAYASLNDDVISYSTASGVISVAVSGLDLNANVAYEFLVQTASLPASAQKLQVLLNGTSGGGNDTTSAQYINQSGSITGFGATGNLWDVSCGQTGKAMVLRLLLSLAGDGRPYAQFQGTTDDRSGLQLSLMGSANRNATTNVTSITFQLDGSTCDWRVWVRKVSRV